MGTWNLDTLVETLPGGLIVTAKGRVGRVTAGRFADVLGAARRQTSRLIVDLAGVDYISGLGVLALRETADHADTLILCGLGEAVRNTLDLAGLTGRVQVEATREAAIGRLLASD